MAWVHSALEGRAPPSTCSRLLPHRRRQRPRGVEEVCLRFFVASCSVGVLFEPLDSFCAPEACATVATGVLEGFIVLDGHFRSVNAIGLKMSAGGYGQLLANSMDTARIKSMQTPLFRCSVLGLLASCAGGGEDIATNGVTPVFEHPAPAAHHPGPQGMHPEQSGAVVQIHRAFPPFIEPLPPLDRLRKAWVSFLPPGIECSTGWRVSSSDRRRVRRSPARGVLRARGGGRPHSISKRGSGRSVERGDGVGFSYWSKLGSGFGGASRRQSGGGLRQSGRGFSIQRLPDRFDEGRWSAPVPLTEGGDREIGSGHIAHALGEDLAYVYIGKHWVQIIDFAPQVVGFQRVVGKRRSFYRRKRRRMAHQCGAAARWIGVGWVRCRSRWSSNDNVLGRWSRRQLFRT